MRLSRLSRRANINMPSQCDEAVGCLRGLHERVVSGDASARDELCALLLPRLRRLVRARFRAVDQDMIEDAVVDALMSYLRCPARYVPAIARLDTYLVSIASRTCIDLYRRARQCRARDGTWRREFRQASTLPSTPVEHLVSQVVAVAAMTVDEQRLLRARIYGEGRPEMSLAAHDCRNSPGLENLRRKRAIDRLQARLRRLATRLGDRG